MNQAFLKRDQGPTVQIGNELKGCVIITMTPDGQVAEATDGLTVDEEISALERALTFARTKRQWQPPRKRKETHPTDPNITIETWNFDTPEQGQHFGLQMALAGLPIRSK